MKPKILVFAILLSIFTTITNQAYAIFGLSKCEKVKKEILHYESSINMIGSKWSKYTGLLINRNDELTFRMDMDSTDLFIYEMTKLAYNHPKCFTRTANLEINKRMKGSFTHNNLFNIDVVPIFKQTPYCKNLNRYNRLGLKYLDQQVKYIQECENYRALKLVAFNKLATIYDQC